MRTPKFFVLIWLFALISLSATFAQTNNNERVSRYLNDKPIKPQRDTLYILYALQEIERAINDNNPEILYDFISVGQDTTKYTKVKNAVSEINQNYTAKNNSTKNSKFFRISDVQFMVHDTVTVVNFNYRCASKSGYKTSQGQTSQSDVNNSNNIQSGSWNFKREKGNMMLVSYDKFNAVLSSISNSNN